MIRNRVRHHNAPVLALSGVAVSFGALQALDNVGLRVYEGEMVALIGPNGAGKTTCFNVISGFVRPSQGRLKLNGRRITDWTPPRRARAGLARSFQNIGLDKSATVWENLQVAFEGGPLFSQLAPAASDRDAFRDMANGALEQLALEDVRDARVGELPIGTAKLVEVACALMRRPRLLLLDEPSSGLGPMERARLRQMLLSLREKRTLSVLMIEHDMELAMSVADYMYVLHFGTPLFEGRPSEVAKDPRVIEAYLGRAS